MHGSMAHRVCPTARRAHSPIPHPLCLWAVQAYWDRGIRVTDTHLSVSNDRITDTQHSLCRFGCMVQWLIAYVQPHGEHTPPSPIPCVYGRFRLIGIGV